MKIKTFKTVLPLGLLILSVSAFAASPSQDRDNDYAYYIMSPKNGQLSSNNGEDKWLRLAGKSGETKSTNFRGVLQIPDSIRVNSGILREGPSQVYLVFDDVQCKYQAKVNRKFFNFIYPLVSCSDGSRAKDKINITSKVSIYLKETKKYPATAYVSVKVLEVFVKGISLPQLESNKGDILRFNGELWSPTEYIPDGQATGDVLMWDGAGWMASKLSQAGGEVGEKGDKGDKGEQGPIGLPGLIGATGAMGPMGPAGATGAMGPMGLVGATGLKGDKGDKGETGEAGIVNLKAGNGILGDTIQGNGGLIAVNTGVSAGQIPIIGTNGRLPASIIEGPKIAYIKDIKPNGVNGGTCDATKEWEQVRDLNTVTGDTSFVSLSQNQMTLTPGVYDIEISAPAYLDGLHKAALVNAQSGEVFLIGSNVRSHNVTGGMEPSKIIGALTLNVATTVVIKHRCATSMTNSGFGVSTNFGVSEVYTQVKITKVK